MSYRRRASPLHAARAAAGAAWCAALAAAGLTAQHPLVLVALVAVVAVASAGAGVGREIVRALRWLAPWAVAVAIVNMLVVRDGLTILARLGDVPPFGQVDLTLEALVYGLLFGLRLLVVSAAFALMTMAVDPDGLLRALRRLSLRSALAAALATRLVPVLAADARRIDEARRCRADGGGRGPAARVAVLRAVAVGALDRALDVAATLEVRGYGAATARGRRRVRLGGGGPWSRHDLAFGASAVALAGLATGARLAGVGGFDPYPLLDGGDVAGAAAVAGALALVALLPFLDRRGIAA
ncbi:MAG TPA: energy-coupling factor transporter transmembrane component T [Baekduia sp.]|nr:energy-coupling factor transporter transmembrane component T [Baekduia sp.]